MNASPAIVEALQAGESASIENTGSSDLAISLVGADGYRLEMALAPGQMVMFTSGESAAQVILDQGDPAALLVIKPASPS